tara:strand:- start:1716 stop:2237 length:522 start_codon:yes stop_codon:yes gene_type:complete
MDLAIEVDDYILPPELDQTNKSYIYGEVNVEDILKILTELPDSSLFIDIGSGTGKLVTYIALKLQIMSTGIEINSKRFEKSLKLIEKHNIYDLVDFENKDFRELYFGNYDILYCCNKVFSKEDNNVLYNKILNEFRGYVILFDYNHILKRYLKFHKGVRTSWSRAETVYIFRI